MTAPKKVAIIGSGIAGLSAAHELLERSVGDVRYDVTLYERRSDVVGGKARSIPVPDSGTNGRPNLPGEHGFRFFPGFYKHLPDTMSRIPFPGSAQGVLGNLVVADRLALARFDQAPITVLVRLPQDLADLRLLLQDIFDTHLGLAPGELEFFADRIWQILTSCGTRRLAEYEKIAWATYLDAAGHSEVYRHLLVDGLSRSLLADNPELASARTVGDTNVQLMFDMVSVGHPLDRLLNGPTTMVWLDPWRDYLVGQLGAALHGGVDALSIQVADGRISGVTVRERGGDVTIVADYYILAIPVERMAEVLVASKTCDPNPVTLDPQLDKVIQLSADVAWMNGIQFFLRTDVPVVHGHSLYVDSPWALTSVSEGQFWSRLDISQFGDGKVHGILSACISEWNVPGILYNLKAALCTREQIKNEVWAQLKRSLNVGGQVVLDDANLHAWFLDPDIADDPGARGDYRDREPLLINKVDSWKLRPTAATAIPNLFIASDYVQTYTDVACMEAANEAARRAVNAILVASGSSAPPCALWNLHEPDVLAPFRLHDEQRFKAGQPWDGQI